MKCFKTLCSQRLNKYDAPVATLVSSFFFHGSKAWAVSSLTGICMVLNKAATEII